MLVCLSAKVFAGTHLPICKRKCSWVHSQVHKSCKRKCLWIRYALVFSATNKYVKSVYGYAVNTRVCKNVWEYARSFRSVYGYIGLRSYASVYGYVHASVYGYACAHVYGYAKCLWVRSCKCLPVCTHMQLVSTHMRLQLFMGTHVQVFTDMHACVQVFTLQLYGYARTRKSAYWYARKCL